MKLRCSACGKYRTKVIKYDNKYYCVDSRKCTPDHPNSISNILLRGGERLNLDVYYVGSDTRKKAKISVEPIKTFLEKYKTNGLTFHLDAIALLLFELWRRKKEKELQKPLTRSNALEVLIKEYFNIFTLEEAIEFFSSDFELDKTILDTVVIKNDVVAVSIQPTEQEQEQLEQEQKQEPKQELEQESDVIEVNI